MTDATPTAEEWKKAYELAVRCLSVSGSRVEVEPIAQALAAHAAQAVAEERERCAQLADLFMFQTGGRATPQAYADVAPEIAAAIRAGLPGQEP